MILRHSSSARKSAGARAFTLLEGLIASGVGVIVLGTTMVAFVVMSRSFDALGNYADLDRQSRYALDRMARDIRQTGALTNWSSTNLMFTNMDGTGLNYTYQPQTGVLSYSNGDTGYNGALLTNCYSLSFSIFQRTPTNGPVSFYVASNASSAKGILIRFGCVKTNFLGVTNSEVVETASIVMRN